MIDYTALHRAIIYSIIIGMCGFITVLLNAMNHAPFNSRNMRSAYYHGCNYGFHKGAGKMQPDVCENMADVYKLTLDDLDKAMEKQ